MRQRRARHLDPALDLVDAGSFWSGAHQQAEDLQPPGLSKRAQLRYKLFHYDDSSIIEIMKMQYVEARTRNHSEATTRRRTTTGRAVADGPVANPGARSGALTQASRNLTSRYDIYISLKV